MVEFLRSLLSEGQVFERLEPLLIKLAVALVIYLVGRWLGARLVQLIDKLMSLRHVDPVLRGFLSALLSTLMTFVVILIALEHLGLNTTSLLALLGAAGLAVGLALKDSLSNFAAGVMLILFKPFKIGDYVEAGGTAGIVESISVFNTNFRTGDNKQIIVPNARIFGGTIVNFSTKPTRRIDLDITISYSDSIPRVRELIQHILDADERIHKEPAPLIAVGNLGNDGVELIVRAWVDTSVFWPTRWYLLEAIKLCFDEQGITIPFPQRDVHLYQDA